MSGNGTKLPNPDVRFTVASARPDTILAWYRKLVAGKFDGSKARRGLGRPRVTREVEQLIVRMASENRDWGYDRIVGAWPTLGM
jgi:putative transposase